MTRLGHGLRADHVSTGPEGLTASLGISTDLLAFGLLCAWFTVAITGDSPTGVGGVIGNTPAHPDDAGSNPVRLPSLCSDGFIT